MLLAFSLALPKAGRRSDARIPMIAITTSSSINVNARWPFEFTVFVRIFTASRPCLSQKLHLLGYKTIRRKGSGGYQFLLQKHLFSWLSSARVTAHDTVL
jgi:hypothetical protein